LARPSSRFESDSGEEAKERKELVEELSQAMKVRGYDPAPIREVMGG
jgi:hypothetical protein